MSIVPGTARTAPVSSKPASAQGNGIENLSILSAAGRAAASQEAVPDNAVRVAELEAELDEMKARWMRAEAEVVNTRTRGRRETEDARQYAIQAFAKDVVEAAENIRRGLNALPAAQVDDPELVSRLREGFEGVERSFLSLLERHGIARKDPTGEVFDPNHHQAMMQQDSPAHDPGTIIQAWTPVWSLHGRLLRPAMVVVAKGEPAEIASGDNT